jgi:hypothetical protein
VDVRRRSIEAAQLVALEGLIDRALSGDASALALLMADRGAYVAPGTADIVPSFAGRCDGRTREAGRQGDGARFLQRRAAVAPVADRSRR